MDKPKPDPNAYFQIPPEQFKMYVVEHILNHLAPEQKYDARKAAEDLWRDYRGRDKDVLEVLSVTARKGYAQFTKYVTVLKQNVIAFAEVAWADRQDRKKYQVVRLEEILENILEQLDEGRRTGTRTVIMRSPYQQKPQSNTLPKPGGPTKGNQ